VNPFAERSTLPYELPDYSVITPEDYEPGMVEGMAAQLAAIDAITSNPEPPTVENTLHALELSGQYYQRAALAFWNQRSSDATPLLEDLEERLAPQFSAHEDAIVLNRALYARLKELQNTVELEPDAAYNVATRLADARRAGVTLTDAEQENLRDLNAQITTLEAQFGRELLAGANEAAILVEDEADLAGLSDAEKDSLKAAAEAQGKAGWLMEIQLPTHQELITQLDNRDLRARLQSASEQRGTGGAHDTRAIILDIIKARAERAQILGFPHHAACVADGETARTSGAIDALLSQLAPPAVANARAEATDVETILHRDVSAEATLQSSDFRYYAEAVIRERFSLDDAALRPYLELNNVLFKGVFEAATRLYGITFTERADLVGYHPDARVFEVFEENGEGLGLFIADLFTRPSKHGGAWMNNLVEQNRLLGQPPVVVNNGNIVRAPEGQPTLLTWDDVIMLFHEFGHALHGLLSQVYYPSQSGPEVPSDFVEYPSQVNEMWAWDPEILASYAIHYETGEPIPAEWITAKLAARQYGEGYNTTAYLGAALLDQAWHHLAPEDVPTDPADVVPFEQAALAAAGVDFAPVPPRYRTTYYNHMFSGYGAAYYSYIWSEVLDADTVTWFESNGSLTRANGDTFRNKLLGRGGSQDPLQSFRDLRGRDADIQPLLERRGLTARAAS
jgi:peptidyl-dipeptidase Dcp